MHKLRVLMIVLAVVHVVLVGVVALLAVVTPGGATAVRILLIVSHPVAAVLLLVAVVSTEPVVGWLRGVTLTLLAVNLVGDVVAALVLAQGALAGSWFFGLGFVFVPVLCAVYVIETS